MKRLESYIDGSGDKKKIDKTTKDWISELFTSFFRTKKFFSIFLALYGGSFLLYYFPHWGIAVHPGVLVAQQMLSFLLAPIVFVSALILLVRLAGLIAAFLLPEIKASTLEVSSDKILISYLNGKQEIFEVGKIRRILLTYNSRGFLVRTQKGTKTYSISLEPKDLEEKFDLLKGFVKETSSFQSREGNIRSVFYTDPRFPDKKWDKLPR